MFRDTDFGFVWNAVEVKRLFSDEKKGWVTLGIETPKMDMQIYVTKTGKIRIHDQHNKEWKPVGV